MARSKSIPDSKPSRTGASTEQTATGTAVSSIDVKAVVREATPAEFTPEAKVVPGAKITKDAKATPEPRKLEVVKNESRKNVLPINLEDEIRRRAYELYQRRGSGSGSEADDWLTAEREVRQRYRQQSA
jgi:hypothetical protein